MKDRFHMESFSFDKYHETIKNLPTVTRGGIVMESRGMLIESKGPQASIGEICKIHTNSEHAVLAEVVGFRENRILLMPLGDLSGISPGVRVSSTGGPFVVDVGPNLIGRVIDGFGNPIDGKGHIDLYEKMPISGENINPMKRDRIIEPLWTQIRAIDAVVTVGKGQRIGIFAGSGVGKSVTLGMIARNVIADVNVIALIGERGREVREFLEKDLGEEGLKRSVVVVVTSDLPPILRIQGAKLAITIAEYFRNLGRHVVYLMDSITRVAIAQREIGLSAGEPPTTKGYTPSVFALMPKILERAGTSDRGTVTGIYTVLVEGDDPNEPVSDVVRSIIDGHIILSRRLANRSHYPAIDILGSISRVQKDVIDERHKKLVRKLTEMYAVYSEAEDMINIGAYVAGSNPTIDTAIENIENINAFLRQGIEESTSPADALDMLERAIGGLE